MRAAWYEKQGAAREVLTWAKCQTPILALARYAFGSRHLV